MHAGRVQMEHFGAADLRIDKKGTIDLVTNIDVAIERTFRAMIAERFPDHTVLGEELESGKPEEPSEYCWVLDPIDGTTNYAHGLPIFCCSIALEQHGHSDRRRSFRSESSGALHCGTRAGRMVERQADARVVGGGPDRFAPRHWLSL